MGPIEPAMKTSRPLSSRASLASLTPVELILSRSSSRKWCASLRRLAPKVLVSMSSAPALMKLAWRETTASGALRFASSGLRSRGTAAESNAPIPPSPTITGPLSRRSRKRLRVWLCAGTWSPSELARHIHPGSRPAGFGTLPRKQVAEASQGRFPQPLSMRSGTLPASGTEYRQGASRDPCPDNARGAAAWPLLGLLWKEIFRGCPRRIGAQLGVLSDYREEGSLDPSPVLGCLPRF